MLDVLLLWHMHQPHYLHPQTGRPALPWVRLHACSGYLDMARALERRPLVRVTVNFVPSLVEQIEAMNAGMRDELEHLAEQPVSSLSEAERTIVRARSFSVVRSAIDARPRFVELSARPKRAALCDADLRDLQCLFLLGWLGFAAREDDPSIAHLEAKGRDFSEADKAHLLAVVRAAAARVLPAWRRLAQSGRVELITSPYHHPIVPLVIDSDAARRARPGESLPPPFCHPDDACEQIMRAQASHLRVFGAAAAGMWPPEGSLSPEAVSLYGKCGVGWLAGDEETLARSLDAPRSSHPAPAIDRAAAQGASAALGAPVSTPSFMRDLRASGARPHARVWRYEGVGLVFRDRDLSDRIGFRYAHVPAERAVDDLLAGMRASGGQDGVVGIFLDGENAWETYPWRGRDFLDALYARLEAEQVAGRLATRTVSEAVGARGPGAELSRLHSGSWIAADFRTWIGDPVKNRAWALLGKARHHLAAAEASRGRGDAGVMQAREHVLAAEASDWMWWYGEPNHSPDEPVFDELFRASLSAVYRALGDEPPADLASSIHG